MNYSAVIFDLDGTLVDSLPDLVAAVNTVIAERGKPPLGLVEVALMVGDGSPKLIERALAARGLAEAPLAPALERFLSIYEADATRLTRPYPGVPEVLERLAAAGCGLAVCTNKPTRATRAVLDGLGLARYFAAVVGGDSMPVKKPDPGPLRAILERLGVAAGRAAMVGDHRNDVAAARGAGMRAIFAGWGYGAATLDGLEPDATIDRAAELPAALARLLPAAFGGLSA